MFPAALDWAVNHLAQCMESMCTKVIGKHMQWLWPTPGKLTVKFHPLRQHHDGDSASCGGAPEDGCHVHHMTACVAAGTPGKGTHAQKTPT